MNKMPAFALAVALAAGACGCAAATSGPLAPSDDPLRAPECRAAIDSLQAQESAADADARAGEATPLRAGRVPSSGLLAARREAALRCLASRVDPPVAPGQLIRAPIVVAPIAVARPAARVARHVQPVVPSPLPVPGPRTVTSCDAGGCWANDGSRLDRVGPNLWGKRGICTLTGTLLQCP
jgi:hypothetical protein